MPGIFLRQSHRFVPMREEGYATEDLLQELIAQHPEVLAGEDESARSWVLVRREAEIPDRPDSGGRWSLDHLFLDDAGVPTFVEVKRSSDTRIRREVVGQILDYAANALAYWPIDTVRTWFEESCRSNGRDAIAALQDDLGADDADAYWARVRTNLAAGKLRLVFVADQIPAELRRIVEFLNAQMTQTEVLAVDVRQYVEAQDTSQTTFVTRVIGETEGCQSREALPRRTRPPVGRAIAADRAGGTQRKRRRRRRPAHPGVGEATARRSPLVRQVDHSRVGRRAAQARNGNRLPHAFHALGKRRGGDPLSVHGQRAPAAATPSTERQSAMSSGSA